MINMMRMSTGSLVIVVEEQSIPEFTKLVNRATNCWPEASPEIKEFADMVTNGKVMQDYKAQEGTQKEIP